MTNNPLFSELSRELRRAYEKAASTLPQHGDRAFEREEFLARILNERLPQRFRAQRGFVLFADGVDDQQIDCIVYDSQNFGTRSGLSTNVVALSKGVAAIMFETSNLDRTKFEKDVARIERLKRRFEADTSHDPFASSQATQPLAYIVCHRAEDHGKPWDVAQAYQDAFRRLDEDGERMRHLVDGILILEPGNYLYPAVQFAADKSFSRVVLNNLHLPSLPLNTIVGLLSTPGPDDGADALLERLRHYLVRFKNPLVPNVEVTIPLQINATAGRVEFKRCFRVSIDGVDG